MEDFALEDVLTLLVNTLKRIIKLWGIRGVFTFDAQILADA